MNSPLTTIAEHILAQDPGVVVQHRLLRDILQQPSGVSLLDTSGMVRMLAEEQWADGSWGRMHSQNTKRKQKIKTTETGVQRAVALGLEKDHSICIKAVEYLVRVLEGKVDFPDPPESNDRWQVGKRLFLTATLSLIEPENPRVKNNRILWQEVLKRTFHDGHYDADAEVAAHCALSDATTMRGSYLTLNNRYTVDLLSSGKDEIPTELERNYLNWLTHLPEGIGYLGIRLDQPPNDSPSYINRWFQSWELLSRFSHWSRFAQPAIDWLWSQQNDDDLWDFGPRPSGYGFLPLSDSWRKKNNRTFDWSTRVLLLLHAYDSTSIP